MPVYIEGRRGQTANGIKVADGRLFVTGGVYGDVRELVAAGSGAPTPLPLGPEISYVPTPDNVYAIVAVTDTRFVVVKHIDGTLYRIDVDPQAPAAAPSPRSTARPSGRARAWSWRAGG